jgi:hypothetical protein
LVAVVRIADVGTRCLPMGSIAFDPERRLAAVN